MKKDEIDRKTEQAEDEGEKLEDVEDAEGQLEEKFLKRLRKS